MQKIMNYTYVGIDSDKYGHTAIFWDVFFKKFDVISFGHSPSAAEDFLE